MYECIHLYMSIYMNQHNIDITNATSVYPSPVYAILHRVLHVVYAIYARAYI